MPQFYTFPGSCAVQVLAGFKDGVPVTQDLSQRHRLTLAIVYDGENEAELKKLGFQKIGTFNKAHSAVGKLALWVAGSEFKIEDSKENSNGSKKDSKADVENSGNK